jgi:UDP-glucose:(heptosyl)LPS alpha-1,3-glucosyltransferase
MDKQGSATSNQILRVAMVVRAFSEKGGLELYAHRTIEGLLERGHHVTVVCEESDSNLTHTNLKVSFFEKANKKDRKAVRIKHHFEAATKAVKELGPFDIIHSQHLPMQGHNVASFHNHTANRLSTVGQNWEKLLSNLKMLYSTAYKRRFEQDRILCEAKVLLFPAKVMRDDFREVYSLDKNHGQSSYVVAYPGANFPKGENKTAATDERVEGVKPVTFLFVGKGFRKKGLDILFAACKMLKASGTPFKLIIAGLSQKPVDGLRLQTLGITDKVEYLGFRKDMENVFAQAQVIVLPSRIEPFGMAPVQGMLEGLVPIVSALTGVSEVLTDGEDALILRNHLDAQELSKLMTKLIEDTQLRESMSTNARKTASALTWDKTVESTLAGYREIVH